MKAHHIRAAAFLAVAVASGGLAGREFVRMWEPDDIRPSPSCTRTAHLSDY